METLSQTRGMVGEELAAGFLAARGYKILLKNFETPLGEIDLIARHKQTLVFVEVKTRASLEKGVPAESVTAHKRRQMVKNAYLYLKRYGILDMPCRFDVVSVLMMPGQKPRIELIENAFGEGD
jgi:putative endonuclease